MLVAVEAVTGMEQVARAVELLEAAETAAVEEQTLHLEQMV
jgi:hypothetical protein